MYWSHYPAQTSLSWVAQAGFTPGTAFIIGSSHGGPRANSQLHKDATPLVVLGDQAGLVLEDLYGSEAGDGHTRSSPQMISVGRKP